MRLDRLLASRAGGSRADATRAIRLGRVTVDGEVRLDPAGHVPEAADLRLDDEPLLAPPSLALFHKPVGVQSTLADPTGRPSLKTEAEELVSAGLHPVGRLDADTSGLLLFSRDGALTQHLLHPRRAIPRTYLVRVEGTPTEALRGVLAAGVATADGVFGGRVLALTGDRLTLEVTEGKHRMVRRMLANAGYPVVELHRLAYGPFVLGDLEPGAWRLPTEAELAGLAESGPPASP